MRMTAGRGYGFEQGAGAGGGQIVNRCVQQRGADQQHGNQRHRAPFSAAPPASATPSTMPSAALSGRASTPPAKSPPSPLAQQQQIDGAARACAERAAPANQPAMQPQRVTLPQNACLGQADAPERGAGWLQRAGRRAEHGVSAPRKKGQPAAHEKRRCMKQRLFFLRLPGLQGKPGGD